MFWSTKCELTEKFFNIRGIICWGISSIPGDNFVKVEAFKNSHGDLEESYGFVFQTPHKKIVFSGDTAPSEKLLLKAKGADILIHEVYSQAGFEKKTPDWQMYHAAHHTSPAELGRIASKINPKKLVLSHILFWGAEPGDIKKEVPLFNASSATFKLLIACLIFCLTIGITPYFLIINPHIG